MKYQLYDSWKNGFNGNTFYKFVSLPEKEGETMEAPLVVLQIRVFQNKVDFVHISWQNSLASGDYELSRHELDFFRDTLEVLKGEGLDII